MINPVPASLLGMLPTSEFTEANKANFSEENKQCAICQECYEVKEQYIILPCLHRFHSQCVSKWFERKNTCPICKRRVTENEEDEHNAARVMEMHPQRNSNSDSYGSFDQMVGVRDRDRNAI